jgi:hypothetical protein
MEGREIVAIWDEKRNLVCLRCATDEEQADVKPWDILREEGVKALNLGKNALICARCARIMYPEKNAG